MVCENQLKVLTIEIFTLNQPPKTMENQEKTSVDPKVERINMKMIYRSILEALNLEKGIFYTIYEFGLRPGKAAYEYLYRDRTKLIHPLRFLVIVVTLATIATLSFLTQEDFIQAFTQGISSTADPQVLENLTPEQRSFMDLYSNNITVLNLKFFNVFLMISVPIAAIVTLLVYGRKQYNIAEHLVINAFIYSNSTVIYLLLTPLFFLLPYSTVSVWYLIGSLIYYTFGCYQIFPPKGWKAILRSFLAFMLQGLLVFMFMFIASLSIAMIMALNDYKLEM